MIRECLRWICVGLPATALLVVIGALGLNRLGAPSPGLPLVPSAVGWLVWQTLVPIILWTAFTRRFPNAKRRGWLEFVLFPLVVAATGGITILVVDGAQGLSLAPLGLVAIFGWIGFSWTLLAVRRLVAR